MTADEQAIRSTIERCVAAWNAGDGAGFAAPFAADAEYTIIDGSHVRGRDVLAAGHQHIFDTVYRSSRMDLHVEALRFLGPDAAFVCCAGDLCYGQGGGAHDDRARSLWVFQRLGDAWHVVAFQNTPVQHPAGPTPADPS